MMHSSLSGAVTRREFLATGAACASAALLPAAQQAPAPKETHAEPLSAGPREGTKFLFIDGRHVERMEEVRRVFHQPVKHQGPVIAPDRQWERNQLHHREPPIWSPERQRWQMWY